MLCAMSPITQIDLRASLVTNTGLGDAKGIPLEKASELHRLLSETPVLPIEEVTKNALGAVDGRPGFFFWIKHCDAYDRL